MASRTTHELKYPYSTLDRCFIVYRKDGRRNVDVKSSNSSLVRQIISAKNTSKCFEYVKSECIIITATFVSGTSQN